MTTIIDKLIFFFKKELKNNIIYGKYMNVFLLLVWPGYRLLFEYAGVIRNKIGFVWNLHNNKYQKCGTYHRKFK